MEDRLPASIEVSGLLRAVEAKGGFGTIIRRGDADRGSLLLLLSRRGVHSACLERTLGPAGSYSWQRLGPGSGALPQEIAEWTQKRIRFDEDLWLIELDIADPERFIAETTLKG